MGETDGRILGLTKIYDSGPPAYRWNLVIVSEGYQKNELPKFYDDAQAVVDHLLITPPFDEEEVVCGMNVYRFDVVSDDSGADDPSIGLTVDTYYDASFGTGGVDRNLSGEGLRAMLDVIDYLPEVHDVVILVNTTKHGGSGGDVAWSHTGSGLQWRDTVVHELGHSAFALADEYDDSPEAEDHNVDGEPKEPNVTAEPDPALVKWSHLVTAGPDVPTVANPDCTEPSPEGLDDGTVGTFEGADDHHCGMYRPQQNCKMRDSLNDFCAVCREEVREFFLPFALPAASGDVTLDTPSVNFNDVPEGTTARRSTTFSVDSCVPVVFTIRSAIPEPFVLVSDPAHVAYPSGVRPWKAYVQFQYTGEAPGTAHEGQVTIYCETTFEEFTVDLVGNSIERPSVAVQLVFDQSGSMLRVTEEGRTKEEVLEDAARAFTDLLYDDNGVGLNTYDHNAYPVLNVQEAGRWGEGKGRDALYDEIVAFAANQAGKTSIGDGVELASDRLAAATDFDERAMVVMTDGMENTEKYIADVIDTIVNEEVFAIGLGTAEQLQPAALDALTSGTGGYLLLTGHLTPNDTFLLEKYYLQILAGVNTNEVVLDPEGYLRPRQEVRIPFDVTAADSELTATVLVEEPSVVTLALETPDGTVLDARSSRFDPTIDHRIGTASVFMRVSLPQTVDGSSVHGGRWHLRLSLNEDEVVEWANEALDDDTWPFGAEDVHGLKYTAAVYAYSDLRMGAKVIQETYEPGTTLTVRAYLTAYDVPFDGYADVRAELVRPDGTEATLALFETETGIYEASITADEPGIYRVRTVTDGRTTDEEPFTREQLRTAPVWMGGVDVIRPPRDRDDELCRLLTCLLERRVLGPDTREWLTEQGVDLETLRKCLCRSVPRQRQPDSCIDAVSAGELESIRDRLTELVEGVSQVD